MLPKALKLLLLIILSITTLSINAQKILKGIVKDQHSDERIPFASLHFMKAGSGKLADSSGSFVFRFDRWQADTLEITYVGYKDFKFYIDPASIKGDTINVTANMERGKYAAEVIVKRKIDRGLLMWKRIVRKKPANDRYRFRNFSYELYNKLELDIKNINRDKLGEMKLLRPFKFILDNVDTTEGAPYLPVYLTEAISQYYYQKSPLRRREVFRGSKLEGVNNESVAKLLGGMDQNVNFYSNFIPVFDKLFVSPISDNGDAYYNYKVTDTQYVSGRRLIHFFFTPRRKGENTFEGDCWVHDTTFAVQKMNLRLSKEANINFVDKLSLIQEFQLLDDSTWFLSRDKFVVDISPLGSSKLSFIGRKTTTYRNVIVNDTSVVAEISKNKLPEETILPDSVKDRTDEFWTNSRHEDLSKNEKAVYHMIDTLMKMPAFKRYTNTINFIATGYLNIGNYQIGPWQNWFFSNVVEGLRIRFDLGTNRFFNKNSIFHGYLAYGFKDQKLKGEIDGMYLFNRSPRSYVYASYVNDFDYGQNYFDEISSDNIFALAIRKPGVPIKFIKLQEQRVDFFAETKSGFSALISTRRKEYEPIQNLPVKDFFPVKEGEALAAFESSVRFRFAYLEKFVENTFYRSSLGSPYPIFEVKYTKGLSGVFNTAYDYSRLSGAISNYRKIPPFGNIYFNLFAGKTFGTLPYMLLDVAPGNEIYYYNKYAYSMINKYEFIHDKYAGFNVEHNFGPGIFRFIGLTRKLKFRQFWAAKGLWGSLSEANKNLNYVTGAPFRSLDGKTYLELGTGVDNILKVIRIDLVWRVLPTPRPETKSQRFGVFGSFRLAF
ncbi:MAG TPA: DUF5686 family protein [Chitinophagaceae bacterium]|nr:DUF5686 family protein [Chitinophagaceae bacterium]